MRCLLSSHVNIMVLKVKLSVLYATNLTVAEAKQGKIVMQDGERYLRLFVSKHKTAKTYGPATLYLKGLDLRLMEKFMGVCATNSPDELLLIRSSGTPYSSHYQRYLQQYCRYCGIDKVPTITQYRKAGSTVAKQALPQGTMAQVSSHESLSAYREISNVTTPDPISIESFFEDHVKISKKTKLAECCQFLTQAGSDKMPKQIQDNGCTLIKRYTRTSQ